MPHPCMQVQCSGKKTLMISWVTTAFGHALTNNFSNTSNICFCKAEPFTHQSTKQIAPLIYYTIRNDLHSVHDFYAIESPSLMADKCLATACSDQCTIVTKFKGTLMHFNQQLIVLSEGFTMFSILPELNNCHPISEASMTLYTSILSSNK